MKRVSLGPRLFQVAMAGFLGAARELKESGSFGFIKGAPSTRRDLRHVRAAVR